MIKILHITQSLGGVETYIREIFAHINHNEFELVLISPAGKTINDFCQQRGIRHYKVEMSRGFNPINDIGSIFTLSRIIKIEKPDLVHLHSSKAGFLGRIVCKLKSKKSIFTPNGLSYLSFTGFKRTVFFMLEVFIKPLTNKVLAVSHSEAQRLQYEIGFTSDKLHVILNSISIKDADERNTQNNDGPVKIGTIARLTYQKNPLLFVEVAKLVIDQFPNTEFSILGAGLEDHLKQDVLKLIDYYNLTNKVHIIEWGTQDSSARFFKELDVFILTSIFEGLPFSLLEAMANKVPCITSKCDGCNDVVQNNVNGFACITKDEFALAITNLLKDKSLASEIGTAGQQWVIKKHDITKNIKELEEFYIKCV